MTSAKAVQNLREVGPQFEYNILSTAWFIGASFLRWTAFFCPSLEFMDVACFLNYTESASTEYIGDDLVPTIQKCLATTHDKLEKDAELLAVLGL
jgi:hypothetical protein